MAILCECAWCIATRKSKHWWEREIPPSQRRSRTLKDIAAKLIAEGGYSHHSAQGATLRLMIERLEEAGKAYVLTALPGRGYMLQVSAAPGLSRSQGKGDSR